MNDEPHDDSVTLTRSEERLHVGIRPIEIGRAVLRKTVVVEERTITVQVRREEVHLEIVPFDEPVPVDSDHTAAHLALPDLVLHEEQVVVTRRVVPVERVRLVLSPVTERRRVTEEVRSERIVAETVAASREAPDARSNG